MTILAIPDRVVWRADLQTELNVTSNTVLRWMKAGKLPPPDVDISRKTKGWRLSTLHGAGIRIALMNSTGRAAPAALGRSNLPVEPEQPNDAGRIAVLTGALEKLLAACESSDGAGYSALSASFVRNIARAALSQ